MTNAYSDYEYITLVNRILAKGVKRTDRTGTGTIGLPFQQMRFDLTNNQIPLLTTKKMFTKAVIHEILWYLRGDTNIKYLVDNGVHIWDEWADAKGELGPVYGAQWRAWKTFRFEQYQGFNPHDIVSPDEGDWVEGEPIDQVADVMKRLRTNPTDRRIVISAWNVADLHKMALSPCHALFQFWSDGQGGLSCHLYQRSCDVGLGVPFNIVQYSILTHMFAQVTGHIAKEFVWTGGDVHIYNNHIDRLREQVTRSPYESPTLRLNPAVKEIDDFKYEDFEIVGYTSHPAIKMEVSV